MPVGEFVSGPHHGRIVTLSSHHHDTAFYPAFATSARKQHTGKFGFLDQHDVAGRDQDIYFRFDDVTSRYVRSLRRGTCFEFSLWRYSNHPKWGLRAHLLHPVVPRKTTACRRDAPHRSCWPVQCAPTEPVRRAKGPAVVGRGFKKKRSWHLSFFECDGVQMQCVVPCWV